MVARSAYTQEIADEICRRLASCESLRAICRDEGMPDERTVRNWALDDREGFAPQYARAREIAYIAMADELLDIADDARNDWMKQHGGEDAGYVLNAENIQRSRHRTDVRKWLLSKMLPKVYGDKAEIAHTGPGGGPVQSVIGTVAIMGMDPIEAARAYQRIMGED